MKKKKFYYPIAFKPFSSHGGVEILQCNDDRVLIRDNYGKPSKPHSSKIRYNAKGNPYFKHNGKREYLQDYVRCPY